MHQLPNVAAHAKERAGRHATRVGHLRHATRGAGTRSSRWDGAAKGCSCTTAGRLCAAHRAAARGRIARRALQAPACLCRRAARASGGRRCEPALAHLHQEHKAVVVMCLVRLTVDDLIESCAVSGWQGAR